MRQSKQAFPEVALPVIQMWCAEIVGHNFLHDDRIGRIDVRGMGYFVATDMARWLLKWISTPKRMKSRSTRRAKPETNSGGQPHEVRPPRLTPFGKGSAWPQLTRSRTTTALLNIVPCDVRFLEV
jgi:hypothetical protein